MAHHHSSDPPQPRSPDVASNSLPSAIQRLQACASALSRRYLAATRACNPLCAQHDVAQLLESQSLIRALSGRLYGLHDLAENLVEGEGRDSSSREDVLTADAPDLVRIYDRKTLSTCGDALDVFEKLFPEEPCISVGPLEKTPPKRRECRDVERQHREARATIQHLLPILELALSATSSVSLLRCLSSVLPATATLPLQPDSHVNSTNWSASSSLEDAVLFGRLPLGELTPEQEEQFALSMIRTLVDPEHARFPTAVGRERGLAQKRDMENPMYAFAAVHWIDYAEKYWDVMSSDILRLLDFGNDNPACLGLQWLLEYTRQWWPAKYGLQAIAPGPSKRLIDSCLRITALHIAAALGLPKLCTHLLREAPDEFVPQGATYFRFPLWCALLGPQVICLDEPNFSPNWADMTADGPRSIDKAGTLKALADAGRHPITITEDMDPVPWWHQFGYKTNFAQGAWLLFMVALELGDPNIYSQFERFADVQREDMATRSMFGRRLAKNGSFHNIPDTIRRSTKAAEVVNHLFEEWIDREISSLPDDNFVERFFSAMWNIAIDLDLPCTHAANKRKAGSITDEQWKQFVLFAAKGGHADLLGRLVRDERWDPNMSYSDATSPPPEVGRGWQMHQRLIDGGTVLHAAVESSNTEAVRVVLRSGADVEARDKEGRTPLHLADDLETLQLLVKEYGADTSARDTGGHTIWHYHACENQHEKLAWLAANDPHKNSSLKSRTNRGRTPLIEALIVVEDLARLLKRPRQDEPKAAIEILKACEDFDGVFSNGEPPENKHILCLVAEWGDMRLIDQLQGKPLPPLEEGVNPLHHLNFSATEAFVKKLRALCPDAPIARKDGKTTAETIFLNLKWTTSGHKGALVGLPFRQLTAHPSCHLPLFRGAYQQLLTPETLEYKDEAGRGLWERFCTDVVADWATRWQDTRMIRDSTIRAIDFLIAEGPLAKYEEESEKCGLLLILENLALEDARLTNIPEWMVSVFINILDRTAKMDNFKTSEHAVRCLRWAVRGAHFIFLTKLLNSGVSIHTRLDKRTTLQECCSANHPCEPSCFSQLLVHADKQQLDELDESGDGLIHMLIDPRVKYRDEKLRRLLEAGANPNLRRCGNAPAIVAYILERQVDAAIILLERGADFTLATKDGLDAALAAASRGSTRLLSKIRALAKPDFDWARTCTSRFTIYHPGGHSTTFYASNCNALHMAAFNGHDMVLQYYLSNFEIDPNSAALEDDRRPAHFAALGGWSACIKILQTKGADLSLTSRDGSTPLHVATKSCQPSAVKTLLQLGPKNPADRDGLTPYVHALHIGMREMVEIFNDHVPAIFPDQPAGRPWRRRARILGAAFESSINANELGWVNNMLMTTTMTELDGAILKCGGCTPLILAIRKCRGPIVDLLLGLNTRGFTGSCNVHFGPTGGFDALNEYCERPFPSMPSRWINPANPGEGTSPLVYTLLDAYLKNGICWLAAPLTPLHAVARQNNVFVYRTIMAHLRDRAADYRELLYTMKNRSNRRLQSIPTQETNSMLEIKEMAAGLRVGRNDHHDPYVEGRTPLHVAMDSGAEAVGRALLDDGAAIESCDAENSTPLYLAVRKDFIAGVRMLLERGANPNYRNHQSYTPLMRAAERGNLEIARLLVEHGADAYCFEPDGMSLLNICGEQSKNPALFAYFLTLGLDPYRQDKAGYMPVHDMILNYDFLSYVANAEFDFYRVTDIMKGLLSMVIDLNRGTGSAILRVMLRRLPAESRKALIDKYPPRFVGAMCNAVHRDGLDAIDVLMRFGADVDAEGAEEGSALMVACLKGRLETVKHLVGYGAKIAYLAPKKMKREEGGEMIEEMVVRNAVEAAKAFPDIVKWLLVERYTEMKALGWTGDMAEEEEEEEEIGPEVMEEPDGEASKGSSEPEVPSDGISRTEIDDNRTETAADGKPKDPAESSASRPETKSKRKISPWSGIVRVEVDLHGVGDHHARLRDESRLDYLQRMTNVRASFRGKTVFPRGWFEGAQPHGLSKWDLELLYI